MDCVLDFVDERGWVSGLMKLPLFFGELEFIPSSEVLSDKLSLPRFRQMSASASSAPRKEHRRQVARRRPFGLQSLAAEE